MLEELVFQNNAELEKKLRDGEVIELAMPSNAVGLLLQDDCGKFCFIWKTCYHGQNKETSRVSFETVEQVLLWIFSQVYSSCMTKRQAVHRYGDAVVSPPAKGKIIPQE